MCPDGHGQEIERGYGTPKPATLKCTCGKKAARVLTFPANIVMKGEGWTKNYIGPVKNRVTWGQVDKIMAEADEGSRQARQNDIDKYTDIFRENL
jgi:hypothetical protein